MVIQGGLADQMKSGSKDIEEHSFGERRVGKGIEEAEDLRGQPEREEGEKLLFRQTKFASEFYLNSYKYVRDLKLQLNVTYR